MNAEPSFAALEDGTVWPVDGYDVSIEWQLRYTNNPLTREQRLFVASVMAAYRAIAAPWQPIKDCVVKARRAREAHRERKP